ncbi:MAG TPA: winged helix-turn-helix domain-containing protein [Gemmatimonadota bacterium]|nr:winged helix-turn-helix domain-containing protein [Gemmatimonadota bacterium]
MTTSSLSVVRDPRRAAVLLDPGRQRLLAALEESPDSASGLARRLGDTRQRINYHLRELEAAGFVELAEERRRGNCIERVLRVTARHYVIDPAALGALAAGDPGRLQDRFSATYLIALAARAIRELAALREGAGKTRKRLATFSMEAEIALAAPADFQAFAEDLARAVAGVVARHQDDRSGEGRRFRLVLGAYPTSSEPTDIEPGDKSRGGRSSRKEDG